MSHYRLAILCLPVLALMGAGCGKDSSPTAPAPVVVGASWRLAQTGISNTVRAFAAKDSMVLAVGDGGIIYSSADGQTWTRRRVGGPNDGLLDVLRFDSLFVAVGMNGTLITSADGETWTFVGVDDLANMTGLSTNGSLIVAVGAGGSIYTSDDGVDWQLNRQNASMNFEDVAYWGGFWVACTDAGVVLWSTDAITWNTAAGSFGNETILPAITATDSAFFMATVDTQAEPANRCHIYRSVNGSNWFYQSGIDAWYLNDLSWTGTDLIAVGEGNEYHLGYPDGLVFSSGNGTDWTQQNTEAPFSLTSAGVFQGRPLVGGSAGYVLSGTTPDQLAIVTSGAEMTDAVWTGTEFVAVTSYGSVMRSSDGSAWSETHSRASAGFYHLAFSGSAFVALGGGFGASTEIYYSPDGSTWERTMEYQEMVLNDVVWAKDKFIVCGQQGTLFTSEDGQIWTRQFVGDSVTIKAALWDGTQYLAAATDVVYFSSDAETWSKPTISATVDIPSISKLVWTGSRYCAVGMIDSAGVGLVGYAFLSTDAVGWQAYALPVNDYLYGLAWTGTRFVTCGREGLLVYSANGSSWTVATELTDQSLRDIAFGGGHAVAIGTNRTVLVSP
jgi:hypothetical protein